MSISCPSPSTDTGQAIMADEENQHNKNVIDNNDFNNNCTSYSSSLNDRLFNNLENDLEDIDSTDELDDLDDLKGNELLI